MEVRALVAPVCLTILPLAVWPGLDRPFSAPKVVWLTASTALLLALRPQPGAAAVSAAARWLAMAWVASFVISGLVASVFSPAALLLGVVAPVLGVAVVRDGSAPIRPLTGHTVGATVCAAVALAQWAGFDPFALAGWQAPIDGASVRMRVYGTLGNPNFVGVLMASSLPLTIAILFSVTSRPKRTLAAVALAVQAAALVATGSRGAVLGLGAGVAVYAVLAAPKPSEGGLRWSRRVRIGLAAVAIFAASAVAVSPARPIDTTAAGRLHLWRIVAPHAWEAPAAGRGPGAVALRFPEWQRLAAREGLRDRRFAGLTDHVHNDYLEALVERGVPGLATLCAPVVVLLVLLLRLRRPVSPVLAGATAAVAAGAACALVDFPMARPAELALWWVAVVLALQGATDAGSTTAKSRHV
jgi:putative inorganic carbon (HCO3(-)) transporter